MATWSDEAVPVLRAALLDLDEPFVYSDDKLLQLLIRAAVLVRNDIAVNAAATYVIDIPNGTITPDPTEIGDNGFVNLMILKVGCLLDTGKVRQAAAAGGALQDSSFRIDTRDSTSALIKLWTDGFCKAYENAKFEYVAGSRSAGSAVLSPFRIGGSREYYYQGDRYGRCYS